jgi:hypothetical protein
MSDIFISYASEDRDRIQSLARALEREGWSIWWDRHIRTGQSFDEVIQEALDASKTVIVVWTKTSVKSSWVKNEARKGLRRKALLPVMLLDEVEIPLEFEHVQAAQLMDWQSEKAHSGFDQFVQDIARVLGPPPGPSVQQPPVKQPKNERPSETKPASHIASLPGSAGQVEQDGGLLEQKPPTPTLISVPLDPPGESLSSLIETQAQEPAQIHQIHIAGDEGRVSGATVGTIPAQSQPEPQRFILVGIGLLLVLGAYVAYWIFSQGPSPVKSDGPPSLTTMESQRNRSQETTPRPIADLAKNITGKDGAPMALIPAGEFQIGSPDGEGDNNEHPRHRVSLDAFYMDKFEVTVARYAEFVRSTNRAKPAYWNQVDSRKYGKLPVVGVDWRDAEAYCRWAGKRLPTEAEWEKAARGTDGRTYPWGNEPPTPRLANFDKWIAKNSYDKRLAPVDSYEVGKSPYGLHHMAGNVWKWTADWYDEHYYEKSPPQNPKGSSSDTGEK